MTTFTETAHPGEYLLHEVNRYMSREKVVIASGAGVLVPGTVLGKVTASGKYVQLDQDAVDGSEVAAGILYQDVDATSADQDAVITGGYAAVDDKHLTFPGDIDAGEKTTAIAQLKTLDIVVVL